jgi:hypothetical protein
MSETPVYATRDTRNYTLGEIADKVVEIAMEKMAKPKGYHQFMTDKPDGTGHVEPYLESKSREGWEYVGCSTSGYYLFRRWVTLPIDPDKAPNTTY